LNGTETNYLSVINSDYFYFNPPADSIDFGEGQAILQVSMKNYLTIQSMVVSFTATILGSVIPVIPDQIYTKSS